MSKKYISVAKIHDMVEAADECINLGSLPMAETIASALADRGYHEESEQIFANTRKLRKEKFNEEWSRDEWVDNYLQDCVVNV